MQKIYWIVGGFLLIILIGWRLQSVGEVGPPLGSEGVENPQQAEVATLHPVGSYTGGGSATRSFNGQTYIHHAEAKVGSPSAGKFYEGWLVDKSPSLRFFSTGRLNFNERAGFYVLVFKAKQDYPEHNDVVITEETEAQGLDGKPEAHVLEGSFPQ